MAKTIAVSGADEAGETFAHQIRTYRTFIAASKWTVGAIAASLVALYFIIQP